MTDRERILRERIEQLRNHPEPPFPSAEELEYHAAHMGCDISRATDMYRDARKTARERTNRIIEMLERDLEELTKPYVAPLPKPTKPRRK
jgi:hypothetical protein